jgi:hypothetical protein
MNNENKLGIFQGLEYDTDKFRLFDRCYGSYLQKTPEGKAAGCTMSAFWVGLGFEPLVDQGMWRHPITNDDYSHVGLKQQTDKLALAFDVVGIDHQSFTDSIVSAHDMNNANLDGNRSHEYKAMQLIYKLVESAGLQAKVSIPEACSTEALKALLNK